MRGTLSILVAALLWAVPSHAQLGHPEVEDVYGGRIRWIDTAILDGHTTRVFISTESANSLFYTDIDHGAGIGTFTRFTAVADADTSDGFGPGVSRFAALDGSGWVYFIHNGTLYGADTDAGSRTTVAGPGVQGVLDSGGMLFYLMEAGGSLTLHFGVVDSADGSFSEDAGSPVAVGPGAPAPNGYTLAVDPVGDTLHVFQPGTPPVIYRASTGVGGLSPATSFAALDVSGLGNDYNYSAFGIAPDGRLFVGARGGLEPNHAKFIGYTDDGGATWDTLNTGHGGTAGANLAFSGGWADYHVYFGTAVSSARGAAGTWQGIGWSSHETHPNDGPVVVDPLDSAVVYLTTDQGIGISRNRGADLEEIDEGVEAVQVNDFDMNAAKTVAWTASKSGIRQVSGYGTAAESWRIFFPNNDGSPYYAAAMDPADASGATAWVGNVRVYRTGDAGSTWQQVFTTEEPSHGFDFWSRVSAIAVDPSGSGLVAVGVNSPSDGVTGGIFLSTDEGGSWRRVDSGPYNTEVTRLRIVPDGGGIWTLYAACEYVSDGTTSSYGVKTVVLDSAAGTVAFSNDMTGSGGTPITNFGAHGLAVSSSGDLYAAGRRGSSEEPRVYRRMADSTTWEMLATTGLPATGTITALTMGYDPDGVETPFVAINAGIYYLDGSAWVRGYQYPVGAQVNVLYWDDLLVGTGTGLYGHFYASTGLDGGEAAGVPGDFRLEQNYPNPFNPTTTIRFALPARSFVRLAVYNLIGQQVALLAEGTREGGIHAVRFSAGDLPSGIYFYRMEAVTQSGRQQLFFDTRKLVLLR